MLAKMKFPDMMINLPEKNKCSFRDYYSSAAWICQPFFEKNCPGADRRPVPADVLGISKEGENRLSFPTGLILTHYMSDKSDFMTRGEIFLFLIFGGRGKGEGALPLSCLLQNQTFALGSRGWISLSNFLQNLTFPLMPRRHPFSVRTEMRKRSKKEHIILGRAFAKCLPRGQTPKKELIQK